MSVKLFNSHYLVDIEQEKIGRVLKLDSLKDGNTWKDMDVLVFNTWLWWYRRGPKQPYELEKLGRSSRFTIQLKKNQVDLVLLIFRFQISDGIMFKKGRVYLRTWTVWWLFRKV